MARSVVATGISNCSAKAVSASVAPDFSTPAPAKMATRIGAAPPPSGTRIRHNRSTAPPSTKRGCDNDASSGVQASETAARCTASGRRRCTGAWGPANILVRQARTSRGNNRESSTINEAAVTGASSDTALHGSGATSPSVAADAGTVRHKTGEASARAVATEVIIFPTPGLPLARQTPKRPDALA